MRYFDTTLLANSRPHAGWWNEISGNRQWFHNQEKQLAAVMNESAILPREAWMELDGITRRVMRDDEGQVYMRDLMPLAKAVNIGKLVHVSRVSGDAGTVQRSMSGQVPNGLDKVTYAYRGNPVPIFSTAYGREWREWNTFQSENFDALADDQEAHSAALQRDMADYALDGDVAISIGGYDATGIRTNPLSKAINLGSTGGANIDLTATATTSDAIDNFFTQILGQMLDDNLIASGSNIYISPEIGRNFDRSYSGAAGTKGGKLLDYLLTNRRINKIEVSYKLSGNEMFGFVPNSQYIRPLIGMATNTTAKTRMNPTDNYQFLMMGAMGIDIRADFNGRTGVWYTTDI
jgi:hypothetical protein